MPRPRTHGHGTRSMYHRELLQGLPVCAQCREANRLYVAHRRNPGTGTGAAGSAATSGTQSCNEAGVGVGPTLPKERT